MKTQTLIAEPKLGMGIYTMPDIAMLFRLPNHKINRWVNTFWDDKLGKQYESRYSWNIARTKAVNFYTVVEMFTFYQLSEAGVRSNKILEAHEVLSKRFKTPYPFAQKNIIKHIKTEGRKVLFEDKSGGIYSLDSNLQFHLEFIKDFFKNLDFDDGNLAIQLWPLGKDKDVVCNPHHQFGQPVIAGTNILAEAVAEMYMAGDKKNFIQKTFNISRKQIDDALAYAVRSKQAA